MSDLSSLSKPQDQPPCSFFSLTDSTSGNVPSFKPSCLQEQRVVTTNSSVYASALHVTVILTEPVLHPHCDYRYPGPPRALAPHSPSFNLYLQPPPLGKVALPGVEGTPSRRQPGPCPHTFLTAYRPLESYFIFPELNFLIYKLGFMRAPTSLERMRYTII